MNNTARPSLVKKVLVWGSWFSLLSAVLSALAILFSLWAVNAKHLGIHDMGLALFFSYVAAAALVGSLYAAPALVLLGGASLLFQRRAGLRFLAAGVVCAVPLAVVMWLK